MLARERERGIEIGGAIGLIRCKGEVGKTGNEKDRINEKTELPEKPDSRVNLITDGSALPCAGRSETKISVRARDMRQWARQQLKTG